MFYLWQRSTKGRKEDELLKRLVVRHTENDGHLSYSCIAPKCGYSAAGNFQRARILKLESSSPVKIASSPVDLCLFISSYFVGMPFSRT